MVSRKIVISNSTGLHVRPAGILAKAAEQCSSRVELIAGNSIANCKSILNILSMTVRCGDEVELCCTGPTEAQDLEYMVHVMEEELEK
ncbi:MAG: HPr family phosphocarrier protein [Lachnospiraceae bacterium]|nr:HPr family phosphocarrier protein [Lachnospiraceae bacterium]